MNEYVTVAEITKTFELILPLIFISLVLSTFLFCIWLGHVLYGLLDFISFIRNKKKGTKMRYSEYLKWSKGLSVEIERKDITLIIHALDELYIAEPSSETLGFIERRDMTEDDLCTSIDILKEKLKELRNSNFKTFHASPLFTDKD